MFGEEYEVFDAAYRGKIDVVKQYLNENENLKTETDPCGRTLLHWAASGGHHDLVKYLLSLDVPVDPRDETNMTPLIVAACAAREVVRGRNPHEDVIVALLNAGADVNAQTTEGYSALLRAAGRDCLAICKLLLAHHANVNIADVRGCTPLLRAVACTHMNIIKLLVEQNDININHQNVEGNTALHFACHNFNREIANILLSHNANPSLKNKFGKAADYYNKC